ncbi:substrate-binding periplasmic protein [Fluviispira multicolorata]|uniref:Transporter substrate-binding domain-containing protein n=1 Tax=Fluviispira multicolorata TaxID=2654512 RepID=A0A833JG30_9BACT|nr:transporter substrate-binding domain-containing protein [Fluviispira multicolorata]KAB8033723.1 transporter substrate-binding domain-containing protein [Fluviispira multicolorata]
MMRKIRIFIFFISLAIIAENKIYSADNNIIKVAFYENFAPYSFKEGSKTTGIFVDVVNLVLHDMMGYKVEINSFPWGRAQDLVRKGEFNSHITAKTSEREKVLLFQTIEIESSNVALVYSKESKKINEFIKISSKQELNNFKMVGYIGDGWAKEQFNDDKDVKFYRTANLIDVLKLVNDNSADLYVSSNEKSDKYIAKKFAYKNLQFREITFLKPASVKFYFCISKNYPNANKIIMNFDKNFLIAKKSGKMAAIIKKYL